MKRREFIAGVGGAVALPSVARAQQRTMPVIGLLNPNSADGHTERLRGLRQGLKEAGLVEGENVTIEFRWGDGQFDRLPPMAADLVQRGVAVIVATGGILSALAAKAATTTIPIVFITAEDPVKHGLVSSLARPGGNLTGTNFLNTELAAKRLELLRGLLPRMVSVAVLINPANAVNADSTLRDVEAAARPMGLKIHVIHASTGREIDAAFATVLRERPDALFVGGDSLFNNRRVQLANLASHHAIPATYADRFLPEVGGLMSYGASVTDAWRQVGDYAGRILKGAKPAELPVVQASKFELVINNQTARMLGLTVPPSLLAIADEVIE